MSRPAPAIQSSSYTAIRRRRICGGTSSPTSKAWAAASRRTLSAWAIPTSWSRAVPTAIASSSTAASLDGLLETLGVVENIVFVVHDWGAALGFDWARRHPNAVKGIAYMEAVFRPMEWDDFRDQIRPLFEGLRSPAGEKMVLEENIFVEQLLPGAVLRDLSAAEMEVYRRPYVEPGEGRRPTLTRPRELPIGGEPAEVAAIVRDISEWLPGSSLPKLFVNAKPGAILRDDARAFCRTFANQSEVTVPGSHFIQEDSPAEIGAAIFEWVQGIT